MDVGKNRCLPADADTTAYNTASGPFPAPLCDGCAVACFLVLLLTARGATVQTASLFIGISSTVIILAEFPSGVFADLFGRKRSFLVSMLLQIAGFSLLLVARTPAVLAAVMVLYGLSRAFASGSLEALAIDEVEDKALLPKATARPGILDSAGLASGALLGGADGRRSTRPPKRNAVRTEKRRNLCAVCKSAAADSRWINRYKPERCIQSPRLIA